MFPIESEFIEAIEKNPSDSYANFGYGLLLAIVGNTEKAVSVATKFGSVDPLSIWYPALLLDIQWASEDHLKSIKMLEGFPPSMHKSNSSSRVNLMLGKYESVIEQIESAFSTDNSRPPLIVSNLAVAYFKEGKLELANETIHELEQRLVKGEQGSINYCLGG